MEKENKILIAAITLLIIFSLSATYAYLTLEKSVTTDNGVAGCFEVNYSGQVINASSLASATDYSTGASSEITLSKAEGCEIYTEATIAINTNSTTTAPISNGALKYRIIKTSGDGKIIDKENNNEELSEKTGVITEIGETILANVRLTENATKYKVYLWIDSAISAGTYNGKSYSGYLYANSIQSSTITQ